MSLQQDSTEHRRTRAFIRHAIAHTSLWGGLRVTCLDCGRALPASRLGRLWHTLTCWFLRLRGR